MTEDAARVYEFAKLVNHPSGTFAGKSFRLLGWEQEFINQFFTEPRKVTAFCSLSRSNGKSSFMAYLCLYFLLADNEPAPTVIIASDNREHSQIIFDEAAKMVRASPALDRVLTIVDSKKTIRYSGSNQVSKGGILKSVSGEANKNLGMGLNISMLAIDEISCISDSNFVNALKMACGKDRKHHAILQITTAGIKKASPGWTEYNYACQIRDKKVTDDLTYLSMIYESLPDDDFESEEVWYKSNPCLSHKKTNTVTIYLASLALNASSKNCRRQRSLTLI